MKKNIAITILHFCFLGSLAQGNFPVLDKDFAWGGNGNDYLMDIHQNENDLSITAAGNTYTNANQDVSGFSKGMSDYWVLKTDTAGVIQYEKIIGGDSIDDFAVFVPTSDEGFLLAGSSASGKNGDKSDDSKGGFDYWIVKISKNGSIEWDKTIGGLEDDYLTCAVGDGLGGFYLGGYSLSGSSGDKSEQNYGKEDYWIVKTDNLGNVLWDLTLGGDSTDILKNIALGPGELLTGGYSISDIGGTKTENGFGGFDFWLNKIDFDGNIVDDKTLGGSDDDFLEEVRTRVHSFGYWISGTTHSGNSGTKVTSSYGSGDMWVLKLDSSLNVDLDRTIGSGNPEMCKDMETSPEGSLILAGWSSGNGGNKSSGSNGGQDFWIYKMDTLGNIFWDRNYGGALGDSLEAIFIKCDRGILAGGYSESSISGDRTHLNKGNSDYWAIELSIPTHPWFKSANVCSKTPLNFFDESDVWPDQWLWNFDDPTSANNTSTDQHPIHTYSKPGIYNVSMTIKEGCQKDTTLVKEITVYDNTVLGNVNLGEDFSICGNEVLLSNIHTEAPDRVTYSWNTGDSTESIIIDSVGQYILTITDANCSASNSVLVDTCPNFGIPNAFTPNGDDLNDVFFVYGLGLFEYELLIFNRWGQLIYKSNDQNEGWDGTVNGKPCQIDVYVYKIIYRGLGLAEKQKVGRVALIR